MDKAAVKSVLESILFLSAEPIEIAKIAKILDISEREVEDCIEELKEEYKNQKRGFIVIKEEKGYTLVTNPENSKYIKEYFEFEQKQSSLSQAAYEVLSIIALNGPITRQEIERIRGVSSDNVIKSLLEKGLIKEAGKLDTIGKPTLYEVTELFYYSLGIQNLEELKEKIMQREDTSI
ncbi:putative transcriptional regulator [Caldicellulosiruptor saccharolyticus DSM 8903]|uniref:Transcriptional regulator n=1 Tax=Caldicellulosiruptor saccharolyticus (strain ATCC 43494 / DSM 8903 / Tp8T 6331) TaxID=351627 RepID=A4XI18_CALS8|nr:SMC-Scp complex subunit ScpB [Caldicellulosiruptor saccharolyticus]ABP66553.1 putative transcriptional regulator [Caldicellulosiruptor saccharolyticus DSM 8903]